MKEFIREYKILKQRSNQKQNLRIWEVLNQKKMTGSNFYFSSAKSMAGTSQIAAKDEGGIFFKKTFEY